MLDDLQKNEEVTLLELLDRLINKGIVISGDLVISIANIDLIYVGLKLVISAVETLKENNTKELEDE